MRVPHPLAAGLDDNYTVYHGVHWTHVERSNYAIFGKIDVAIVGPTGKILLIEQKAGLLAETPGGLARKYLEQEKNVASRMARSADALHRRLRQCCKDQATFVDSLLCCPDPFASKLAPTTGIDPARIVDAAKKDYLMPIVRAILPESGDVLPAKEKIHRFPGEILQLVPEADAVVGAAQTLYTRLSGGLVCWNRA